MVDNFEQIGRLLKFEDSSEFYFLQILQRKKDHKDSATRLGRNNNARLIKAYYIYSLEQFMEYKDEIIALCTQFNARAGINLNARDNRRVALEMLEQLAHCIKSENYNVAKLYNSCCGMVMGKDKHWIVDLDNDTEEYRQQVISFINSLEPHDVPDKIKAIIPTKNGHHLITSAFNSHSFGQKYADIEVHKNNPTVLYVP